MGGVTNPLLDALDAARGRTSGELEALRSEAVRAYGFAVPSTDAADAIREVSPRGVVEIGAGTGYWAAFLASHGIDVVAFDPHPAPVYTSDWFAGTEPWFEVLHGDHSVVAEHPGRSLLVIWPTRDETWPLDAIDLYASAGGATVCYVGEGPGGRTGDDAFHARLGEITTCQHCVHGVADSPCICDVAPAWERTGTVELPHWPGYADDLFVYRRIETGKRRRSRRRVGGPRW